MSSNNGVGVGANAALIASVAGAQLRPGTSAQSFSMAVNPTVNGAMMLAVGSVLQQLGRLRRRGERQGDADLYSAQPKHRSSSSDSDSHSTGGNSFVKLDALHREL